MDLDLTDKNALVCGASRGIGRATALELSQLGANVTLLARSRERLQQVQAELNQHGAQEHHIIATDIADTAELKRLMEQLTATRTLHIVVNNTGGPAAGTAHEADPETYMHAMRQHLAAAQTILQAALPGMRKAGYGRIVNIISTSVKEPLTGLGVSNTTRAAMAGWSKTLSGELAVDGITVNNILPGSTATERLASLVANQAQKSGISEDEVKQAMLAKIPAGRVGKPEEVGAAASFLCTPAAAYINGVSLAVDGGRTRSLS